MPDLAATAAAAAQFFAGAFGGLALLGIGHALASAAAVLRFGRGESGTTRPGAAAATAATVLKPLHGVGPGLAQALATTLRQDHPGPVQLVLGVQDPHDPAIALAEALRAAALRAAAAPPGPEVTLVVAPRIAGPNRKVSNLLHMAAAARHPVLVIADADIAAPPDWLRRVTAPLLAADPAVGLVTCLYRGVPAEGGIWSALAAVQIDWHFLPNAVLGESLGVARGCYGATMALRRGTLERLGGFGAFLGLLADDHALGAAVRRLGLRVAVSPVVVGHVMHEPSLAALLAHELRWARTLRLLSPGGYAGLVVTHALPAALACLALAPGSAAALALLGVAGLARLGLAVAVLRRFGGDPRLLALLPVRDLLSCAVWAAGLFGGEVAWQGRYYRVGRDGSLVESKSR